MTNAHDVIAAYWAAANARDWTAFGALLADDVVYRGPQTREQVRGREAYVRFNVEGFAYDWHMTVQRIVGEGQHAASWIEFTGLQGAQPGLCFFDLADDGRITQITGPTVTLQLTSFTGQSVATLTLAPADPAAPPINMPPINIVFSRLRASGRSA